MLKPQRPRVEHHPGNVKHVNRADLSPSVRRITEDGMADGGEMDPQLMSPAGSGVQHDMSRYLAESPVNGVLGNRLLGA